MRRTAFDPYAKLTIFTSKIPREDIPAEPTMLELCIRKAGQMFVSGCSCVAVDECL